MESAQIQGYAIAEEKMRMHNDAQDAGPTMESLVGDCRPHKMAEGLFLCESEGACPFSINFADRKICKNNLVIAQCKG